MRLFGRKDEEDEKYSRKKVFEKKELTEKEKFFKEKFPRRRTGKKGEIKTWTRRERYFVLGVFLTTVATSAVLGMSARAWKLPNLPRFSFPKILSEETIIIEGNPKDLREVEIVRKFDEMTKSLSGVYGFFVIRLSDGSYFGVNERETFEAASFNKLPVMLAMYKSAEGGSINLSSTYVLKEEDKTAGSGSLSGKPAGTKVTYGEIVKLMGKESDNTAFNIAKKIMGDEKILKVMRGVNLPESLLLENETTAYDIGFFWKSLWEEQHMSRETKDALLGFMTDTIYEGWISRDIPAPVAHKYGSLTHVRNDGGVVMSQKPYILVMMSKGIVEKEADEVIPEFSRIVYDLEEK